MNNEITGQKIADKILGRLGDKNQKPCLEIILIGQNKASETFVKEKQVASQKIGFQTNVKRFPKDISEAEIIKHIEKLNESDKVHGILVQLPIPNHIDNNKVFNSIEPLKDVDCLTPLNLGKLMRNNSFVKPCSVSAIEKIIEDEKIILKGKNIVIINNSNLIGKPLSMTLSNKDATVTICNKETQDLNKHTKNADILITATGSPKVLKSSMVGENTVLIDAGYSYVNGDLIHESEEAWSKAEKVVPVPGGVGPVTVAMTMKNLYKCFKQQRQSTEEE